MFNVQHAFDPQSTYESIETEFFHDIPDVYRSR